MNPSLWVETSPPTDFPRLEGTVGADVVVIGGGIAGVTAAHLLKRAGKTVALVEMHRVGRGVTGYTTAKLTVGHKLIYADLVQTFGDDAARAYAASNQAAVEQMEAIANEEAIDCDWERTSNYVYTESPDRVADIEREVDAARRAGVDAHLTTETDLPYDVRAAVRVDDQAQFHPRKYVVALAQKLPGDGIHLFELTRALHVRSGDTCVVETTGGEIHAKHVVVATHLPFLDRGFFFAKAHPSKSYAVAVRAPAPEAPRGMYISVEQPTRSVRSTPASDGTRFIVIGGEGHKPGEETETERHYEALERFAAERFGAEIEYRWSTHDYMPVDGLPYIGRLRRGDDRVYVATGFAKWGLTKGTFAAQIVADAILGRVNPWAELYDSKRVTPKASARRFVTENADVARRFFGDRVRGRPGRDDLARLAPGDGTIARVAGKQYAVYRDQDGTLHAVSPRCTHLGCVVGWNRAERAWECPCHGSRYDTAGRVINGPATRDLERRELPDG